MQRVVRNLVVLGALGMELKAIGKRLEGVKPHPERPDIRTGSRAGATVHLVRTGVGKVAAASTKRAIRLLKPDALVCLGTAGGLVPELKLSTVLACSTVLAPIADGRRVRSDAGLLRAARDAGAVEATCLTVEKALYSPEQKARARKERKALLCEMEAWFAGAEAAKAAVPFLALKVISDTASDALPDVERFMTEDGLDAKRAAGYFALHPDEAARAARFLRNAKKGMETLGEVFGRMVDQA